MKFFQDRLYRAGEGAAGGTGTSATATGGTAGTMAPSPGSGGATGGAGGTGGGGTTVVGARPEHIPEKFWDGAKGATKVDDMAKSYVELERRMSTRNDDLIKESRPKIEAEIMGRLVAQRPVKAEDYKVEFPSDFKLPEGIEFKLDAKSPLMDEARKICFEHHVSQDAFSKLLSLYAGDMASKVPDPQKEVAKLGEGGRDRIEAVKLWAAKHLGDTSPEMTALWNLAITGEAFVGLEKLMKAGAPAQPAAGGNGVGTAGSNGTATKTAGELLTLKMDPRYSGTPNQRDPAFIAMVEAEFKKTYPGRLTF